MIKLLNLSIYKQDYYHDSKILAVDLVLSFFPTDGMTNNNQTLDSYCLIGENIKIIKEETPLSKFEKILLGTSFWNSET